MEDKKNSKPIATLSAKLVDHSETSHGVALEIEGNGGDVLYLYNHITQALLESDIPKERLQAVFNYAAEEHSSSKGKGITLHEEVIPESLHELIEKIRKEILGE